MNSPISLGVERRDSELESKATYAVVELKKDIEETHKQIENLRIKWRHERENLVHSLNCHYYFTNIFILRWDIKTG